VPPGAGAALVGRIICHNPLMVDRVSAGILLFHRVAGPGSIEVLLGHPGGPFFASRDLGEWSIPKGEVEEGEDLEGVARREFREETGHPVPDGPVIPLGSIRQKGGKVVHAWAAAGDLDPTTARSMTFTLQWPPNSGTWISVPEIDRVEWFAPAEARRRIKEAQIPFIDRLLASLG
jgi:predicted NUDIX family NTP pyrophosphohydrolase